MSEANDAYRPPRAELLRDPAGSAELASRWSRLWASTLDSAIGLAVTLPIMFSSGFFDGFPRIEEPGLAKLLGLTAISYLAMILIHGRFVAMRGQTVGKMALGIRMVRTDGSPVSLWRWLGLRTLPITIASLAPLVGNLLVLLEVLFIFRDDRRCVHDLIADTRVVRA